MTKPVASSCIKPAAIVSRFEMTPEDVHFQIFEYLANEWEVIQLVLVSKRIKAIVDNNQTWKILFKRNFPKNEVILQIPFRAQCASLMEDRKNNVHNLRCVNNSFFAHRSSPVRQVGFIQNIFFTVFLNKTAKLWKREDGAFVEIQELNGEEGISYLGDHQSNFLTTSRDGFLRIFKESPKGFKDSQCLIGYRNRISCFGFHQGCLFTGSAAGVVTVWNQTKERFQEFQSIKLKDSPRSFDFHEDYVFVGCCNNKIHVLEKKEKKYSKVQTLVGNEQNIHCLAVQNGCLFSGSFDGAVKVWGKNKKKFEVFQTLKKHDQAVTCLRFQYGYLFTGSLDNTVCIWKKHEKDFCLLHTATVGSAVHTMCMQRGVVYLGLESGEVATWDFAATRQEIFLHLAQSFEAHHLFGDDKIPSLKARLLKMDPSDLDAFFCKLYGLNNRDFGEDAFYGIRASPCSPMQIARGIRDLLKDLDGPLKRRDNNALLPHPRSSSSPLPVKRHQLKTEGKEDV